MNNDVYLIRIEGTDFESPQEIKIDRTFFSDEFTDKGWAITQLATYIKPMVQVGRTLRNLTVTTYVVREENTYFGTGMIVLTDKMSTANKLAKDARTDGHHGTTEYDFNKVGTENMCIAVRDGDQVLRKVMSPDHQVGTKFDVKKHCKEKKFQEVCYGYNVYTQRKKHDAQKKEWDAWLGDEVEDSAQATEARYNAQKNDNFPYMPFETSRHFSRYRYAVLIQKAHAAAQGRDKTIINKNTVLRLFPNDNVFLTGQFLYDENKKLWAEVEVADGTWQDCLGFVVQGIKHDAWTISGGAALLSECAKFGIQLKTLELREGVVAEDVPMYRKKIKSPNGNVEYTDTGMSMWNAITDQRTGAFFYPTMTLAEVWDIKDRGEKIDTEKNLAVIVNDITMASSEYDKIPKEDRVFSRYYYPAVMALAQNYRYYAIALTEREAIFETLYNQLKDAYKNNKITVYCGVTRHKKDKHNKEEITLRELIDRIQRWELQYLDEKTVESRHYWLWNIRDTVKRTLGEQQYDDLMRYAFDFPKWCKYVWQTRMFNEVDKSEDQLRAELEQEYRKLYYEDNPVCDISELNDKTTLWVEATSAIGIEGERVYLDKDGNWAINSVVDQDGMPKMSPVEPTYDDNGNIVDSGLKADATLTVTWRDMQKQEEKMAALQDRLEKAEAAATQAEQQKKKQNFLPLVAAAAAALLN